MRLAALSLLVIALAGCAGMNAKPWAPADKQMLVQGCQEQLWQRAENQYLVQHNLAPAQLPKNFRETMRPTIEPSLQSCGCFVGQLEKESSYEELVSQRGQVNDKLQRIIASGVCAQAGKR